MCKFTNRLFVLVILSVVSNQAFVEPAIARLKSKQKSEDLEDLLNILTPDNDNLHYDQRQKGEENLRIKLDGFFVGLPAPESSGIAVLNDDFLENLGEELLLGLSRSRSTTTNLPVLYSYKRVEDNQQKSAEEAAKAEKIIVEIPAPKKDVEQVRLESKEAEDRKIARSKLKISQLLGFLLRARESGALIERKDKP